MNDQSTNKEKHASMHKQQDFSHKNGAVYAAVSALLSLFGLGGLFIGYFIDNAPVGTVIAGGEPILRGSLIGVLIEVLRGSITPPQIDVKLGLAGFLPLFLYLTILLLLAALAISFSLTIAAMLTPDRSRRLCFHNGRLLLVDYGLLFLGNMLFHALKENSLNTRFFDYPTVITAALLVAVLFLTAFAENRKKSIINLLLFLFSLLPLCGLIIPKLPLILDINELIYRNGTTSFGVRIALLSLCWLLFLNVAISLVRLNATRAYPFDSVRFGLQFICVLVLIATYLAAEGTLFDFFLRQPMTAALLLIAPLFGFILSTFSAAVFGRKARKIIERKSRSVPIPTDFEEQTEPLH